MKTPQCKLCGKAHWSYEDHDGEPSVPEYVREMAAGAMGSRHDPPGKGDVVQHMGRINVTVTKRRDETPVTKPTVTKLGGRPKKHDSAAARQRAYRERSK